MNWWVTSALDLGPIYLGSWIFWVIFSIVLHELGHGYAAIRQGDDTPIYTGHMTWNPVVHMGHMSLIAFAILGIAWGAMPVNPSRFRSRYGDAIVSVAGPVVNLLLALVCLLLISFWPYTKGVFADHVFENVTIFLWHGLFLNMTLMVFNLLPVPPLDGSRIVGDFFPSFNRLWQTEQGAVIGLIAVMALFYFGSGVIFEVAATAAKMMMHAGQAAVVSVFGAPPV